MSSILKGAKLNPQDLAALRNANTPEQIAAIVARIDPSGKRLVVIPNLTLLRNHDRLTLPNVDKGLIEGCCKVSSSYKEFLKFREVIRTGETRIIKRGIPVNLGNNIIARHYSPFPASERTNQNHVFVIGTAFDHLQLASDSITFSGIMQRIATCYKDISRTDQLTGALNRQGMRSAFRARLEEISCDPNSSLGVLLLDLDHFKRINDSFGHHAGDEVLKGVVRELKNALRREDAVIRYGGDELVIMLAFHYKSEIKKILPRIVNVFNAVQQNLSVNYPGIKISASIGCCVYDVAEIKNILNKKNGNKEATLKVLMDEADRCAYNVKHMGRDGCLVGNYSDQAYHWLQYANNMRFSICEGTPLFQPFPLISRYMRPQGCNGIIFFPQANAL